MNETRNTDQLRQLLTVRGAGRVFNRPMEQNVAGHDGSGTLDKKAEDVLNDLQTSEEVLSQSLAFKQGNPDSNDDNGASELRMIGKTYESKVAGAQGFFESEMARANTADEKAAVQADYERVFTSEMPAEIGPDGNILGQEIGAGVVEVLARYENKLFDSVFAKLQADYCQKHGVDGFDLVPKDERMKCVQETKIEVGKLVAALEEDLLTEYKPLVTWILEQKLGKKIQNMLAI
ncbi:hypothetical protein KBC79_05760 [Candidatus Woesebacteria bacterium]|nr:hypothetical protein [Candidatus Woesebacteria bacterium]